MRVQIAVNPVKFEGHVVIIPDKGNDNILWKCGHEHPSHEEAEACALTELHRRVEASAPK